MSSIAVLTFPSRLWRRIQSVDVAVLTRWLYENRWLVVRWWLAIGAVMTAICLPLFWSIGSVEAVPPQRTMYGTIGGAPGQPGLGSVLIHHWWGWLILAVLVPLFWIGSPALLVAVPLALLGIVVSAVFGPVGIALGLILWPFLVIIAAPTGTLQRLLDAMATAGQARGVANRFRMATGLYTGVRRGPDGGPIMGNSEDVANYRAKPLRGAPMQVGAFDGLLAVATEKHVLVIASTRAGKGRDIIVPNLLLYPGSVFVLDPKGENALESAQARTAFGDVQILDPFGITGLPTAFWNPLLALHGETLITDAQVMADALIYGSSDDHWASSARELLTGLLVYVATSKRFDQAQRTLPTVRSLLTKGLWETLQNMAETGEQADDEESEKPFAIHLEDEPEPEEQFRERLPDIVSNTGEWGLNCEQEEWSSIVSTCIEQTKWLNAPQLKQVLSSAGPQIDFTAFLDRVQSIYICLPAPYFKTFSRWLRLLTATGIDAMTRRKLTPPYPVRFVLDELAQLGTLDKVESALTLSAGYGVQIWGIWHHVRDINRCYPESGIDGWMSSSGVQIAFNLKDNETVDYLSKASGVMTPQELRLMPATHMLCMIDGENPLLVWKVPGPNAPWTPRPDVRISGPDVSSSQPLAPGQSE